MLKTHEANPDHNYTTRNQIWKIMALQLGINKVY